MATPDRPNPLKETAAKVGTAWSAVSGLVGALVTFGILSGAQGDAVNTAGDALSPTLIALGTVVGGVLPLLGGLLGAFQTASSGKDHVTPVVAPMDNFGNVLTPKGE
jgi:hypothetical protein